MMTQATLIELAKQGNPKAIATLISRSLQPQGVTAKAAIRGKCLRVMLEAQQVPNEQASVQCIRQGLTKLDVKSIQTVQVSGREIGKDSPAWIQDFELVVNSPPVTEASLPDEAVGFRILCRNRQWHPVVGWTELKQEGNRFFHPIFNCCKTGGIFSVADFQHISMNDAGIERNCCHSRREFLSKRSRHSLNCPLRSTIG